MHMFFPPGDLFRGILSHTWKINSVISVSMMIPQQTDTSIGTRNCRRYEALNCTGELHGEGIRKANTP